jgi:protein-S-isoprenylcysteine O-methyltransferase Ste14
MYLTIFGISLGAWMLFEIWVFLRDRGQGKAVASKGGRGVIIALAIAISLAMNVPGIAPMLDVRRNFEVYFYGGIALVWAGLLFRFWSIQTLGKLFSTRLVIQERHALITKGPYRVLRNPSYTGGLMTMIGFGLSLGNGLSLAILLVTGLVVYVLRIRTEEEMLGDAFGEEYEEYKKRTWRLIPFVW